jgi:hypothetical protein
MEPYRRIWEAKLDRLDDYLRVVQTHEHKESLDD